MTQPSFVHSFRDTRLGGAHRVDLVVLVPPSHVALWRIGHMKTQRSKHVEMERKREGALKWKDLEDLQSSSKPVLLLCLS
jgi:hypothetical protein